MLPLIIAAAGAYLIGDSIKKDKKVYATGGMTKGGAYFERPSVNPKELEHIGFRYEVIYDLDKSPKVVEFDSALEAQNFYNKLIDEKQGKSSLNQRLNMFYSYASINKPFYE